MLAFALCYRPALAAGVVGDGTPQSCTEAALLAALAGGGLVTFDCGSAPVVIIITAPSGISPSGASTVDGGGLVTLDGNSATRLFSITNGVVLTLTNITLRNGT
jgi:hypothetical protein